MKFRLAVVQLHVSKIKADNLGRAQTLVKEAAGQGAKVVVLPECFKSPYGTGFFAEYAEKIPGESTQVLSETAKNCGVYLVAGSVGKFTVKPKDQVMLNEDQKFVGHSALQFINTSNYTLTEYCVNANSDDYFDVYLIRWTLADECFVLGLSPHLPVQTDTNTHAEKHLSYFKVAWLSPKPYRAIVDLRSTPSVPFLRRMEESSITAAQFLDLMESRLPNTGKGEVDKSWVRGGFCIC